MALSVAQLSEHLIRSGLLPEEQIKASAQSVGGLTEESSAEGLAKQLVRDGRLTLFQAQLAVNGKAAALVLGSYLILEKLGQGGMGQVYKARHRTMKREVALKVISAAVVKDETSLRRFQREVEAAAQLNHPNIVTAHDAGEHKGTHFLVMELVRGADLASTVKKSGPMKAAQAVRCVLQAARGLAYAHSNGIVHRDIKPANLLLDESGTIKILDMGLARFEEAGQDHASVAGLTGTGMLMGTIDYMSPEQAMDSKTADARSDIYSLGCTLYYLVTGQAVYVEDTVMKRIMAHQAAAIPQLPILDKRLQAMFERMIAKKPEQRYQSTAELANDLQSWLTAIESDRVKATAEMPILGGGSWDVPEDASFRDEPKRTSVIAQQPPAEQREEQRGDTTPGASATDATIVPQSGTAFANPPTASPSKESLSSSDGKTVQRGSPTTSGPKTSAQRKGTRPNDPVAFADSSPSINTPRPLRPTEHENPPKPQIASPKSGSHPPRRRSTAKLVTACGGGALLLMLLGVILIRITGKDGTESVITVPEGTQISVDPGIDGRIEITRSSGESSTTVEEMPVFSARPVDSPTTQTDGVPDWVRATTNNGALQFREGSVEFATLTLDKLPQWTIELQVSRSSDSRADEETILSTFGPAEARAIALRIWGENCVFGLFDGKTSMYSDLRLADAAIFTKESTHHIAIAFDGRKQTMFFDGQPQGTVVPERPTLSPRPLCLGNLWIGHDPRAAFRGWVDELRISNIVRYTSPYVPTQRLEADPSTIALYHFDEGRGERLHDVSGHGHHGTILNAKWLLLDGDDTLTKSSDNSNPAMTVAAASRHDAMRQTPMPTTDTPIAETDQPVIAGTLAPPELRLKERSGELPPFKSVLRPGQPLGEFAAVSSPGKVENIISWSIEPVQHRSMFRCLDVSTDGLIATGGTDNAVRIWTKDWQLRKVLPGHANVVCAVAFSPDGKSLASISSDPNALLALWDVESGQLLAHHSLSHWYGQLAWLPDGQWIARGGRAGAEIINPRTGERREGEKSVEYWMDVAASPDGSRLVCTIQGKAPQILDTATLKKIRECDNFSASAGQPGTTDWSRDGKSIVMSALDRTYIIDTRSFQIRTEWPLGGLPKFSPDSTMLALASVGKIFLFSTLDWSRIREFPIHVSYDFAWSADGRQLLTSNGSFDVQTGQPTPHPAPSATFPVVSAVSSDGRQVATIANSRLRIFDGSSGQLKTESTLEHWGANQLLWQPQGKKILRLLTSIEPIPAPLVLIDSESGKVAHALNGHQGAVWRAAWSPDGKHCASVGEDATCRISDAASGTELQKLTHSDPLWWVQWSGDGTKVATGSSFSAIAVWDVASGKLVREFKTLSKPMSAPRTVTAADGLFGFLKGDTQLFYMAGDTGFEVLDLKSGQISSLGQVDHIGGNRRTAAWSKDFSLLGVYDGYNEFHMYAAGDTKPVTSIRFFMTPHWLADGKRLLGGDNSITWLCGYDLRRKKRMGVLIPELGTNSWAALSSDGHFAGSPDAKDHLVVVAMHRDGRLLTMTMEEFQSQFKWTNDPEKVRFLE